MQRSMRTLPPERYRCVDYADFVAAPKNVIDGLLAFVGLPGDAELDRFLAQEIARRSSLPHGERESARLLAIAGPYLSRKD